MWQKALERALAKIRQMLASKGKMGESLGATASGFAINSGVSAIWRMHQNQRVKVGLQHMQAIHASDQHGVNTEGHGTAVGHIYQGDDGQFYKNLSGDTWKYWNGVDWVD